MKYISPSFSEIKENDPYKKIALVAHNCYQVEKQGQEELFVKRILSFKHYAMIEHMMFSCKIDKTAYEELIKFNNRFIVLVNDEGKYYASFSLRPLLEEKELDKTPLSKLAYLLPEEMKSLLEGPFAPCEGHLLSEEEINSTPDKVYRKIKNVSIRMVTDRGVTHEIVRHRIASYAQESTRYCNYSKDKFGNELTFIKPIDYDKFKDLYDASFKQAEDNYFSLIKAGSTPEMARAVLPNKLKATIIMTASIEEWEVFFLLRCDQRAHPDMRELAQPIEEYFKKEGYLR